MHNILMIEYLIAFEYLMYHFNFLFISPRHIGLLPILGNVGQTGDTLLKQEDKSLLAWIHTVYKIINQPDIAHNLGSNLLIQIELIECLFECKAIVGAIGYNLHTKLTHSLLIPDIHKRTGKLAIEHIYNHPTLHSQVIILATNAMYNLIKYRYTFSYIYLIPHGHRE